MVLLSLQNNSLTKQLLLVCSFAFFKTEFWYLKGIVSFLYKQPSLAAFFYFAQKIFRVLLSSAKEETPQKVFFSIDLCSSFDFLWKRMLIADIFATDLFFF